MLELINQLDGFDPRGNIKVLMATNRYSSRLKVSDHSIYVTVTDMSKSGPGCIKKLLKLTMISGNVNQSGPRILYLITI